MNGWLDKHKAAAYRTRWIGLIGVSAMLASIGLELSGIYFAVSVAEVPFQGDFAEIVMKQVWLLVLLAVSFVVRAVFLLTFKPKHYSWIAFSWLFSVAAVAFYLWEMSPGYSSATPVCGEDGRCYTIYEIARTDWAALAGLGFVLFSFVRVLVTAAIAGTRHRYR